MSATPLNAIPLKILIWFIIKKPKDVVISKAKDYYKNNKDRFRKQARDKHRNLSEEEKNKKENMEKIDITRCVKRRKQD